jgi:acetyl esterase/lipase
MPIGYLTGVALTAWWTAFALAPRRWPRLLARISLPFGAVVSELPVLAALLLTLSTALAFAQGDIASPGAWGAVAVAAATLAGLAVLLARSLRARPALCRAMDEGLGDGWRARRPAPATGRAGLLRALLAPFPVAGRDIERIRNVSYGDAGGRNRLDIYRHRGSTGGPTLVYFHGGGFFSGGKSREARLLLHRLARRGWVCLSADYRLRPRATFPDHLVDAKRAIAWAHDHAGSYGADASTVVVAGSSAGGHLTAMAALTPGEPAFQDDFEDADTSVAACIGLYGYYGNYYGQGPESSPQSYLHPDAPPFFLAQGDQDSYSPRFLDIARRFADGLRETSSRPVVYAELPGAQHAFDVFRSVRFVAVVDAVEAFTTWALAAREAKPRRTTPAGT